MAGRVLPRIPLGPRIPREFFRGFLSLPSGFSSWVIEHSLRLLNRPLGIAASISAMRRMVSPRAVTTFR